MCETARHRVLHCGAGEVSGVPTDVRAAGWEGGVPSQPRLTCLTEESRMASSTLTTFAVMLW